MSGDELLQKLIAAGVFTEGDLPALEGQAAGALQSDAQELATRLIRAGKLTRFQAQQALAGKAKALALGDYVLLDKIGAGGMGQVFKARHRHMDRLVALKLLPPALMHDDESVKRFQREVKAAARLSHPNIVAALDARNDRGMWYLVMEYVAGRDLSSMVKERGPLPLAEALGYITQAARGLASAHAQGVIHRDIKPANLLVDQQGTVKILDMGLARLDNAPGSASALVQDGLTQAGQTMGTAAYMAPEQAYDTRLADARADIYSLGCTLYRLLTAEDIFPAETLTQAIVAHRDRSVPSLRSKRADVSPALDAAFARMVAKQPEDRFQTMEDVVFAIERLSSPQSASAVAVPAAIPLATPNPSTVPQASFLPPSVGSVLAAESLPGLPLSRTTNSPSRGSESVVVKSSKYFVTKVLGGVFATIIAPILVTYLIKYLESQEVEAPAPADNTVAKGAADIASSAGPARSVPKDEPPLAVVPFEARAARAHQEAWAKHLHTSVETTNSVGMKLVLLPPGEYQMGSTHQQVELEQQEADARNFTKGERSRFQMEIPRHRVVIPRPLWCAASETTVGQFRKFISSSGYRTEAESDGRGGIAQGGSADTWDMKPEYTWQQPGHEQTDGCPVTQINWNDAVEFCNWLCEQEKLSRAYEKDASGRWVRSAGNGYRLPTEAEWEYACRAGTSTRFSFGDDPQACGEYAWFNGNSHDRAQPVATKKPNAFGLFDMHGNAQERCHDLYGPRSYLDSATVDPQGAASGTEHVCRGGHCASDEILCSSLVRNHQFTWYRNNRTGFRVVRSSGDAPRSAQRAGL